MRSAKSALLTFNTTPSNRHIDVAKTRFIDISELKKGKIYFIRILVRFDKVPGVDDND